MSAMNHKIELKRYITYWEAAVGPVIANAASDQIVLLLELSPLCQMICNIVTRLRARATRWWSDTLQAEILANYRPLDRPRACLGIVCGVECLAISASLRVQ